MWHPHVVYRLGPCHSLGLDADHAAFWLFWLPWQELAWSSFALLKNVNCCSVLLLQPGSAQSVSTLMARGAVSASCVAPGDSKASLQHVSQVGRCAGCHATASNV